MDFSVCIFCGCVYVYLNMSVCTFCLFSTSFSIFCFVKNKKETWGDFNVTFYYCFKGFLFFFRVASKDVVQSKKERKLKYVFLFVLRLKKCFLFLLCLSCDN